MKKILYILLFSFIVSCQTEDITPMVSIDVFNNTENTIPNGTEITFTISVEGNYTLTLIDKNTNQVISREKFFAKKGMNKMKVYTNSLQSRYLYLLLEDVSLNKLGKTTIIIK